jgi:predicted transposase/invertase (TIGR01784 family)
MDNGTMTIEDVLVETGWAAKFEVRGETRGEARGEVNGKREVAKNLVKNGFDLEQVVKFSGLDTETVRELSQEI